MDISLKRAHFYCLLLLSHYLCAPAVGFRGGLLTVSVPQQCLVSFSLPGFVLCILFTFCKKITSKLCE